MDKDEIERRVEAAADAGASWVVGRSAKAVDVYTEETAADARAHAERFLRAAFPELFAGTHWLAPMEPTAEMTRRIAVLCDAYMGDASGAYASARDAYLGAKP